MTQDTRKDRRVKIVSLNVRYKSATVDEFIENHSHDVSKGGIFIKTASPFPPGTLLKFEIRLSDDQSVIAGVGRVVWKRDGTIGSNERPAGMGVKFIKIDDPSKTVIDKLVSTKADAGKAYDSEQPAPEALVAAAATPAPAVAAVAASTPAPALKPMQPTPAGGIAATSAFARKSTMMGIGGIGEAAAAAAAASRSGSAAPAAVSGGAGMFPATNSQAEMPPKQEQTVMKQAAELLEEALKEAGGSMDEIGQNPLFATGAGAIAQSNPPPPGDTNATIADSPSAKAISGPPKAAARTSSPPVDALAREAQAAAAVAKKAESVPPTARESPSAKVTTVPPTRGGSFVETVASDKKKGGSGAFIGILVAVAAVAAGVYMFRDTIFPAPATSNPTPVASQPPPPPSVSATASAADTASAAASAAVPSASASASAAPTATAPPTATQTATATAVPTATATAVPTARPTATQTTTAVPTATATQTATATATATQTAPKPTATATAVPKPKPTSDNPY